MKNRICFLILIFSSTIAQGEFVVKESALTEEGEDVVIDLSFLSGLQFEDPHFSPPPDPERIMASLDDKEEKTSFWGSSQTPSVEWQGGQIQILKDIPYSYPQLSRKAIEAQVLEELKKDQKQ